MEKIGAITFLLQGIIGIALLLIMGEPLIAGAIIKNSLFFQGFVLLLGVLLLANFMIFHLSTLDSNVDEG